MTNTLLDAIKLRWRLVICTSTRRELWFLTVWLLLVGALAALGLFYFLTWLDTYYPDVFSLLILIGTGGYILGCAYWVLCQLHRLLKLKQERYRLEDKEHDAEWRLDRTRRERR